MGNPMHKQAHESIRTLRKFIKQEHIAEADDHFRVLEQLAYRYDTAIRALDEVRAISVIRMENEAGVQKVLDKILDET